MSILGCLTVILVSTSFGLLWLQASYGFRSAAMIVLLSQAMNLAATANRFRTEISHAQYTDVSPDSFRYIEGGRSRWVSDVPLLEGITMGDGTTNTFVLSQWFFTAFGDDRALVFLAGSTCGLLGLWLTALAIRRIRPDVHVLFGYLVCMTPSVAYWSSSFGKDAFTFLSVGAALWVVADAAVRRRVTVTHVLVFVLADALMLLLRIDIAIVLLVAMIISWWGVRSEFSPLFRRGLIAVVFVAAPVALIGATLLGLEDPFGIVTSFSGTYERTAIGGSAIDSVRPGGIAGIAVGFLTAIFRPFPWEFGLGGLVSSLDIIVFVAVAVVVIRAVRRGHIWHLADARITVFGSLFVISVFAQLSQLANLGLLVRLRSLIIPVLIVTITVLWPRSDEGPPSVETEGPDRGKVLAMRRSR